MATPELHPDLASAIHEVLARATQPLAAAKIRTSLAAPYKVKPKLKEAFVALLNREASAGRWFEWTSKKAPLYSTVEPGAWAEQTIVKAAETPLTLTKLLGSVSKHYPRKQAESLISRMCESGELVRMPLFGGGTKTTFCSNLPPDAEAFRRELDAARAIVEAGYRKLGSAITLNASPPAAGHSSTMRALTDDAERVMNTLAELEPQKGLLVTAARLRRALPDLSKQDLDATLTQLQKIRRVILHRHSNPNGVSEAERETLIQDTDGNYYAGACWRVTPENP